MLSIIKFFIEGICTAFLGLFGIVGNLVSIVVLSSTELDMMPSFRHLMKMLGAFDAIFLVFTLGVFCVSAWSDHYNEFIKPWLIPWFLPIIQVHKYLNTFKNFLYGSKMQLLNNWNADYLLIDDLSVHTIRWKEKNWQWKLFPNCKSMSFID